MIRWLWVVAALLLAANVSARATESERPLSLATVLDAVDSTHPMVDAAQRSVEGANGTRDAARGAWDPNLSIGARWVPGGEYQNRVVDAELRQATPLWGLDLFAGYRVGQGDFPVYKGDLETLSGGELRAGIDVPLWKDGPVDARRTAIDRTRLDSAAAECRARAVRLTVRRDAAVAYWHWVAAGGEMRIQRELLAVAEERDAGLHEQAARGAVARIVAVDNERIVLDRQSNLVAAERDFRASAQRLSLYLRDARSRPLVAPESALPAMSEGNTSRALPGVEADVAAALRLRPEVCALNKQRQAAGVQVRLAKNQRAPSVNAQGAVARDLGSGPAELQPTEIAVALKIEMPLGLREARGKLRAARAEAGRVDAELRSVEDAIRAQVRQAHVDLAAASTQVDLAERQLRVALALADAERERFAQGSSDLVVVNLRELAAAHAARLVVRARTASKRAQAEYLTATGRGL